MTSYRPGDPFAGRTPDAHLRREPTATPAADRPSVTPAKAVARIASTSAASDSTSESATKPPQRATQFATIRCPPWVSAAQIAAYDPQQFEALFRQVPALHRFPAAMAKRAQELGRTVVERYDGDTASIWNTAESGRQLLDRIAGLPGFGDQKARIFTALLGKQFDVQPVGWREAAGAYGDTDSHRSVADVVDAASLQKVRAFKKEQKVAAPAAR